MQQQVAEATFGFLTAVESGAHGIFGGYLLVDGLGRPLEFHCTAPVKVSRAQQILYGATLPGHLHGRQIGGALLAESGCEPMVVLTDSEPMLHVRHHTRLPVAFVRPGADAEDAVAADAIRVGGAVVAAPADADATRALADRLRVLAEAVDLCEPFERIRAAIDEAQRH